MRPPSGTRAAGSLPRGEGSRPPKSGGKAAIGRHQQHRYLLVSGKHSTGQGPAPTRQPCRILGLNYRASCPACSPRAGERRRAAWQPRGSSRGAGASPSPCRDGNRGPGSTACDAPGLPGADVAAAAPNRGRKPPPARSFPVLMKATWGHLPNKQAEVLLTQPRATALPPRLAWRTAVGITSRGCAQLALNLCFKSPVEQRWKQAPRSPALLLHPDQGPRTCCCLVGICPAARSPSSGLRSRRQPCLRVGRLLPGTVLGPGKPREAGERSGGRDCVPASLCCETLCTVAPSSCQ